MASYAELFELRGSSQLHNDITIAVAVKAQSLIDSTTPSAAQVTWALEALRSPQSKADELINYVLAKNRTNTTTQILEADNATVQTNVDDAVNVLVAGGA